MKKQLLITAALVFLNFAAFAQLTFGPKIGLNASSTRFKNETNSFQYNGYDPKMKVGLQLGFLADYEILYNFSIRAELLYNQSGYKYVQDNAFITPVKGKNIYNYLTIPVNAVYKVKLGPGRLQASVGPYASLAVIGKFKEEDNAGNVSKGDLNFKEVSADSTFGFSNAALAMTKRSGRAVDAGVNIGIGYQYRRFLVNAQYSLGMVNRVVKFADQAQAVQDVRDQLKLQNRMFAFSVTYLFGKIE